jgi:hypothetical protein
MHAFHLIRLAFFLNSFIKDLNLHLTSTKLLMDMISFCQYRLFRIVC